MISSADQASIVSATTELWRNLVTSAEFRGIFAGKEIGHRIADFVDERTTDMLEIRFDTKHEIGANGNRRARSMGDIWLCSGGIYNPINVKAGEAGKNGQPNLVSLRKLLAALLKCQIDSYYLLIVKMKYESDSDWVGRVPSESEAEGIEPQIYFVDMLDYLDYVSFDAGPGQAMLRERDFYNFANNGSRPIQRTVQEKIGALFELIEDGNRRLIRNREVTLASVRDSVTRYRLLTTHALNQDALSLG